MLTKLFTTAIWCRQNGSKWNLIVCHGHKIPYPPSVLQFRGGKHTTLNFHHLSAYADPKCLQVGVRIEICLANLQLREVVPKGSWKKVNKKN